MKKIKKRKQRLKIRRRRKRIFILATTIILIITTITAKAGIKDSTLTRNIIDGYYAITTLDDGKHLYNLELNKINNKVVYCIELGKHINNNIYNSTTNLSLSNIPSDKLDYIRKAMYYGYTYKNHNDIKYYMAAQEMIWEKVSNREVYWTQDYTIDGQPINIDSYKNEITNLINKHNVLPSMDYQNFKVLTGKTKVLEDTNNVLSEYEITKHGNQRYEMQGNKMYVYTNLGEFQKDNIELTRKNYYTEESILYTTEDSQMMMSPGTLEMPVAKFSVETYGLTIKINIVDKDTKQPSSRGEASLTGGIFELYDEHNNLIKTFESKEGETIKIEQLISQRYHIKQIKASTGYKINNNIPPISLINYDSNATIEQEIIKSNLEILKIYGNKETDEYQSESGINFDVYDKDLNKINTITTNKIGFATTNLIYGNYTIKQDNTTPGYQKVNDINISINENSEDTIRYNLYDDQIKIKLNINTLDKETNKKILDNKIEYKLLNKITNKYISYNGNDIFTSNEKGEVLIPVFLPYGTYQLEQVNPPKSYLENNDKTEIIINDNSPLTLDDNNNLIYNINIYNTLIKGQAHITIYKEIFDIKHNSYSIKKEKLENKELILYSKEDITTPYNEIKHLKDEEIDNLNTDELGHIDTKILYLGEYCLKNKELLNNDYCFNLEQIDNKTSIVNKDIEITIPIKKYNITITNLEKETNNAIPNTIVELYTIDNNLINTSITNEEGIIKLSNLTKGKYYIKEKEVNSKYKLNKELLYFEIKDKDIDLKLYNELSKNKIFIPNTLSNNNHIIEKISLLLILIGLIIYEYKKKYN